METLPDRFTLWALRSGATAMVFAGLSVLTAAVPLFGSFPEYPVARAIAGVLFQLSGVFVVSGSTAIYLSRPRAPLMPNERATLTDAERPPVAGWLILLAVALVALPMWLIVRLQPFLAEWGRVLDFLAAPDLWRGANANMSGVVLLPLAAALTPPFLALAAMVAFVVESAVLLALLLLRSRRFPRIYVTCVVLSSALVIVSVRAADAAMMAGDSARQLIESSTPTAAEAAQLTEVVTRYTSIIGSTIPVLVWTLFGYLSWVPAMIVSRRVRATFAFNVDGPLTTAGAPDLERITSPPRFPG